MSEDILSKLENLTPEELAKVGNLIGKFSDRHDREVEVPKKRKKRKKTKKRVDEPEQEVIVEHEMGRKKPRKRIIMPDEAEQPNEHRSTGIGRSQSRNPQNQPQQQQDHRRGQGRGRSEIRTGRGGGRTLATAQTVKLSGENKFLKMRERNNAKADVKIDQALWKDRVPEERREEFEFMELQCLGPCGLWFDVNPNVILLDQDSGEPNFTCNNCSKIPRGQE